MLNKKEREQVKIWQGWERYSESDAGKESAKWTLAELALEGRLNIPRWKLNKETGETDWCKFNKIEEDEYIELDRCYSSYDQSGLVVVGPSFGPVAIPPSKKAMAWFGEEETK